ncbi:adenosylcobinamide-phosphate synthase CbiB [Halosegnis sp.]|uniref:adenosylcobinamide-phosphate synthase CbiB n=1 Tax=Halosegnis sp. TaxID=2864959 RepID=UPI0035D5159B
MSLAAAGAVLLAGGLDRLVGEPPERLHPVALFGSVVARVDRAWPRPWLTGGLVALMLPLAAAVAVAAPVALAARVAPAAAVPLAALALFATTSLRLLLQEARAVLQLVDTDLSAARDRLRSLAGRDSSDLNAGLVRSAAVESAAENLADGLVAPLSAFALAAPFGLAAAAGAAAWVKAVNTLDSMLGYPAKSHGTASARLDDAVMWIPARLSALALALAAAKPMAALRARAWTDRVPSPNSGWPMGVAAAAVGARLEKPGVYVLNDAAGLPGSTAASQAVDVVARAGLLAWAVAAAGLAIPALAGVVA